MKNILENTIKWMCAAVVVSFAGACNDWTQTESLGLKYPGIADQNPELYAQYLSNLRSYKKSDHKIVYAEFVNVETPSSRGHHLAQIPDSVDIVSLVNPDNLPAWVVKEKNALREEKGTRCVYTVSYAELETAWDESQAAPEALAEEPGEEPDPFTVFVGKYMDAALVPCTKYDYDGITIEYPGKATLTMTPDEKAEYLARQKAFFDYVAGWLAANPRKMLNYEGNPQYLTAKQLLSNCEYILLQTSKENSIEAVVKAVAMANEEGVPSDRYLVSVQSVSLDKNDKETGYFGNGQRALGSVASWIAAPGGDYTKAGLAIYNLQNDYFNADRIYTYTRDAIYIMNPAPKN